MRSISHHKKGLNEDDKASLDNSATLSMITGVGMCLVSLKKSRLAPIVFGMQLAGVALFPGLVWYRLCTGDRQFGGYVHYGGFSILLSWIVMGLL